MTGPVELTAAHCDALLRFFTELPEGDRTFIREDVTDPDVVRGWTDGATPGVRRWVALADGAATAGDVTGSGTTGQDITGYGALLQLPGWSDHVGEIRLVVAPGNRGSGLGRRLARHAMVVALEAGLTKLVVEVVAEQGAALALFTELGFTGEALLVDHIRDRTGRLRDLLVLAHHVRDTWAGMSAVGLTEALGDDSP